MTAARLAPLCLLATAMGMSASSLAGVFGIEPTLGIAGDYATNPALLSPASAAESHAVFTLDAPTSYVGDQIKWSLVPQVRLSDARGYATVDSDYGRLTVRGEYRTPRTLWSLTTNLSRDSSLYRDYLTNGGAGVRRDTVSADGKWLRHVTERLDLSVDANAQRVQYGAPSGVGLLTDYRYGSVDSEVDWLATERDKLNLAVGVGRYDSLDHATVSRSANAQMGYIRSIGALWTMTINGGYSRASNDARLLQPLLVFTGSGFVVQTQSVRYHSRQTGTVYSFDLKRGAQRWSVDVLASRQLAPSGFAYLSREDVYQVRTDYSLSERVTLAGDLRRTRYQNPISTGGNYRLTVDDAELSMAYRWTRRWTLTLSGSKVLEHVSTPSQRIDSSTVRVGLTRQFDWRTLP